MNKKVPPTASNRRKKELAREENLVTYKRKRKTIDSNTIVPPNTVDSANEGISEALPPTESVEGVNIPQGSEFETESAQAGLGAQPPLPNVSPDFDVNIPIVGGYYEGEGATSNDDVGLSNKSLLRSFRFHKARSIALGQDLNAFKSLKAGGVGNSLSLKKLKEHYAYKLEKVLSDGTAAAAKKKKGLTTRCQRTLPCPCDKVANKWSWGSAVLAYMYYNLGAASRDDRRQFACCTTLLESWIFAHFPKLVGIPKEMDSDAYEHCTCWKWDVSATDRYGGTALLNFREALDNYKLKDVSNLWNAKEPRKFNSKYEWVDCFSSQMWKEFILKKADRGRRVREGPLVCTEAYLEWFASVSWTTICPITVDLAADDDVGIHQSKSVSVNEHGDIPVHQSEDIVEQYDASHHEYASLSPNINLNDQQITALNDQLQKLKEDKEKESVANINPRETLKENVNYTYL
ncbi:hypothetical protein GIB67_000602 [Kingdonia uniflora]|uniref:Aminotransferase-like plant mobile domain-containing protein n=1 Tax=Kingdonia uniflora TaxID=39325 RepID=A0A7J7P772_9MAGN|nr:hypothetical protein GIB67_000602 [Kingdonia uniflora]